MKWEQKIIDLQEPSIRELMLMQNVRKPEDDYEYISRIRLTAVDQKAQCVKEDGTVDLNVRDFGNQELQIEKGLREKRGEIIQGLRGEPTTATITEEKRERGASAFMRALSVDALKNKFRMVMKDLFKPSHAEIMAEALKKAKNEN